MFRAHILNIQLLKRALEMPTPLTTALACCLRKIH
eukprot:COSAG01_NODE_45543_length_408_cov_1.466019_1_plen_34_part_10